VREVLADLGDRVRAGQVLIRLDSEKQQYTLEQQKAAFARALAQYGATDVDHLPEIEDTPDVKRATADLNQATQNFDRADELYKRTLIPQQALDDAQSALQARRAQHESARQNAKNLRASIQASQATMKLADRQLRDTDIRAPFDGFVEKRLVNLGELVKAQMPVMAIVRLDPLKVVAEIPEKLAPWISDGRPVELHVDAYRDRSFTGKVTRISPAVNTSTRAFPFEALVPNTDAVLKPGTFARVHVESGKVDDVLTLPYAALQYRYGVNRVFVVNGDRLAMRELQVGERLGERIEIVSGVKEGERVAITDVDTLNDGALVNVTK
jgi:multidrug efflux pump subunit AcrA (membrane-fusion protein)